MAAKFFGRSVGPLLVLHQRGSRPNAPLPTLPTQRAWFDGGWMSGEIGGDSEGVASGPTTKPSNFVGWGDRRPCPEYSGHHSSGRVDLRRTTCWYFEPTDGRSPGESPSLSTTSSLENVP